MGTRVPARSGAEVGDDVAAGLGELDPVEVADSAAGLPAHVIGHVTNASVSALHATEREAAPAQAPSPCR